MYTNAFKKSKKIHIKKVTSKKRTGVGNVIKENFTLTFNEFL